ncbi:hypothetical protein ACOMHN_018927 [Nucella lapillus]
MSFQKAIVIAALGKRPSAIQMADVSEDACFYDDGAGPRKRRRLTHLSTDEKVLRRKLKNRVAAQTARDRKKALMQDLEEQVAQLQEEKKLLMKENAELRLNQSTIKKENDYLKNINKKVSTSSSLLSSSSTPAALAVAPPRVSKKEVEEVGTGYKAALPCKTEAECPGSAVPAVSLPKEQIQALSRVMMHYAACALTLSLMLCLVSWKNSAEKVEGSSSRKRKQPKPARRPSVNSESLTPLSSEESPLRPAWWGPHQQTWTPSMN